MARLVKALCASLLALMSLPFLGSGVAHADALGDEGGFVAAINAERASHGAAPLAIDSRLTTIARTWSAGMATAGTIWHNPDITTQAPSNWTALGENVGMGGPDVAALEAAFVASPHHFTNMINPSYNAIGVGVVWKGSTMYVTEDFMQVPAGTISAATAPAGSGWYRLAGAGGESWAFGAVGTLAKAPASSPVVGVASTPSGQGEWLAAADGSVFAQGDAPFAGSLGGHPLNQPIVGIAATPTGNGYWLVARDGGIFSFGDAHFFGSTGAIHLNQPIVGMTATPSGNGYWFVAADGGIFSFGDARFLGSTGALHLNQPVVGMAAAPTGNGYWLVARDGGIFSFGDAPFYGSTGATRLNQPIVGMASTRTGHGYRFVAADGGIFAFGDAPFLGSAGGVGLPHPVVGMIAGS